MTAKERSLAAEMLRSYGYDLDNQSCNDWEWPLDWTRKERITFLLELQEWGGIPEEEMQCDIFPPQNSLVAESLASKLDGEAQ